MGIEDVAYSFKEVNSVQNIYDPFFRKDFIIINSNLIFLYQVLPVGPICLHTSPITDALHGFAMAWKTHYASVLHEEAKVCFLFIKSNPFE